MSLKLTSAKYLISKISFHNVVDRYGMSVSQMTIHNPSLISSFVIYHHIYYWNLQFLKLLFIIINKPKVLLPQT